MEVTMFQLRSFVHQRLYAAAEEILGEVERTVTLALSEAEVGGFKEGGSLRHQRGLLRQTQDSALLLTSCSAEPRDENQRCMRAKESSFSLSPDISGPSDQDENNWNEDDFKLHRIKEEQEEPADDNQRLAVVFDAVGMVKREQAHSQMQVSFERPPDSPECPAAPNKNSYSDEEAAQSKGEQSTTTAQTVNLLQGQRCSADQDCPEALPGDKRSAPRQKDRSYCHLCGKGFQYIGSLMKHIKTHESKSECSFCGKVYQSTKQLVAHLKGCHGKGNFCGVCGETFGNARCLRAHERVHAGIKDFVCQECGKTFQRKEHLVVHVRTHSGEKPYHCDICGKAFSQSQNLTIHKRSHSGEKPYHCGLCGKLFNTSSHLKTHMRYHSGEKPYACDVCGKRFRQSGQVSRHKTTHTGERPYACHLCGMRYRFAPNLKMHLQTHEKTPAE